MAWTAAQREAIYDALLKLDTISPVFPSPEEACLGIAEFWDKTFEESSIKKESDTITDKELAYIRLIALRYYILTLGTPREKGEHFPLLFSLLAQISNTIMAIIKLADEGFDYQALSLARNLMELYMTLLTVLESPSKRTELRKAVDAESARKVWHKYFNKKHFIQMIEAYTAYEPEIKEACKTWVEETYAELSSFAHNDYVNMICFTFAAGKDVGNPVNLWGEYVSRQGYIYQTLFKIIGPADSLLTAMLRDEKIDINMRGLFNEFKDSMSFEAYTTQNLIANICIAILADISGMQEAEKMISKPLCNFERPKRTLQRQIMAKKLRDKKRP